MNDLIIALLNVITCAGIIILVEATAMTGGKKQLIGVILIIVGLILGAMASGVLLVH